jgi:hypothetical protein
MQIVILTKLILIIQQCKIENLVGSPDLNRKKQLTEYVTYLFTT